MKSPPQTSFAQALNIWSVLGLSDRGSDEWGKLRAFQYAQIGRVARTRLMAQALAAMVTVLMFAPIVGQGLMAGWLGALCGSLTYSVRSDSQFDHAVRRRITPEEFRHQTWGTLINACVWTMPIYLFEPHAPMHLRLELWTVLAMLMTVSAVIVPIVPLTTLLFTTIVGGASVVEFMLLGQPGMAGVAALFVVCVAIGTIEASRNFLVTRLAEAGVEERNEVVKLLLREFDEEDADWLWQMDAEHRVRDVTPRFAEALERRREEVEGANLIQILSEGEGKDCPGMVVLAQRLHNRESFSNLLLRVTVGGERRYWSLSGAPRFDDMGGFAGFHGVASDVTEQQESTEKIAWLARYDTLTGLPNRMIVVDAITSALAAMHDEAGQTCAFLMIDLDRFKAVNDTLGHPVGDQLLAAVAERLGLFSSGDYLFGRLGGDEFAVVVRNARDRDTIDRLCQAIIAALSAPYCIDGHELSIGASIGSALGPDNGDSAVELMRNADFALYRAKRSGRGCHVAFDVALKEEADLRARLEAALQKAIEQKEFELFYQPVVDAQSERLVCCEALLRWNSPELGQVAPDTFLALAEETRLILPIGAWVLAEACRQVASWPGEMRMSVNVSEYHMLAPAFIDHVVTALSTSGLEPWRLEIEVTEGVFQRDPAGARATLERLLALGCTVTLDDFGSGQASISFLCSLRFSAIKLDRALIKGAAMGNAESVAMIRAAVAVAESMEMITIAKGVENEDEFHVARQLHCARLQGIAYGRPMSGAAIERVLRHEVTEKAG